MNQFPEPLIVVFGGAGYIGSTLVKRLLRDGFHVRIFDSFLYGKHGLTDLEPTQLDVVEGDICDTRAVSAALLGAETVILLAAEVGRRVNDIPRTNMRETNLLASSVVLDAAIEHGATRFIFASTDSVYGVQTGVMYETGTPEPVSLYSRLKLRMEERVIRAKSRAFHPTALRICTCHGYSPRMRFDLLANAMIRDAVCLKEITVVNGDQYRPLIHVDDAASAFVQCLKAHVNLISGEVFNVGANDQNVQVKQVAKLVKSIVPEAKVNFLEGDVDLSNYHLSSSKIEKILDFNPCWSLEQSMVHLKEMLEEKRFGNPYSLRYCNTEVT